MALKKSVQGTRTCETA